MERIDQIKQDTSLSKKQITRQVLLESAVELFLEQGFPKASMRDIAAKAGIKAGSMFYHFKSKDELLFVIMENSIKSISQTQQQNCDAASSMKQRLRALVKTEIDAFLCRDVGVSFQVLIHEWRHLSQQNAEYLMGLRQVYEKNWRQVLDECFQQELITASPAIVRRLLNGSFAWINYWYRSEGELTVDQIVDEVLKMLIREI